MSRKLHFTWEWRRWLVGMLFPHGGMCVWSFYLGPLGVEWWPLAGDDEEVAF